MLRLRMIIQLSNNSYLRGSISDYKWSENLHSKLWAINWSIISFLEDENQFFMSLNKRRAEEKDGWLDSKYYS